MKDVMTEKWNKRPLIISGPCSAETEEQVIETATRLANTGKVDILRAGIWKPRTKPGMFEGIGVKGLPWLANAKKVSGLPIAVEVATAKHVEMALQFDVDLLWIGARTTVNPFSVQEVCDAFSSGSMNTKKITGSGENHWLVQHHPIFHLIAKSFNEKGNIFFKPSKHVPISPTSFFLKFKRQIPMI